MSQENVDMLRKVWEALERGDLEPGLAIAAPDFELDLTTGGRVDGDLYHGREAVRGAYETWAGGWDSTALLAKDFIDIDDDHLIVHFEARGHSRHTGLDFKLERYWVYTLRDSLVVRVREFETRAKALEAVGLAE